MEFAYWVNPLLAVTQRKTDNRRLPGRSSEIINSAEEGCETLAREW